MLSGAGRIARIAIDSRAIVELLDQPPRNIVGRHGELTEVLRDHGVLVYTCQQDAEELKSAIVKQPTDVRRLWVETMKVLSGSGRWRPCRPTLQMATSGLFDAGTYPGVLRSQVDLVVVGQDVAGAAGFEQAGFGVLDERPRACDAGRSPALRDRSANPRTSEARQLPCGDGPGLDLAAGFRPAGSSLLGGDNPRPIPAEGTDR